MIALSQVVIVEGRYDKIKLDSVVDGIVLTTDGFEIFRDTARQQLFRHFAKENGIIVLTDSDDAGFKIRKFISDIAGDGKVYHAYIPEQAGKERRKPKAGKAGLLGVEGIDTETIYTAIKNCLVESGIKPAKDKKEIKQITAADLYEDGFNGQPGAAVRRRKLLETANLPTRLSTKAMLDVLTRIYGYDRYKEMVRDIKVRENEQNNDK